jgi:hypothetical protein
LKEKKMSPSKEKGKETDIQLKIKSLIAVGKIDTVYRDVYVRRARALLSEILSYEDYRRLIKQQSSLPGMAGAIRTALEKGDWNQVKVLSEQLDAAKKNVLGKSALLELGEEIYNIHNIFIDPFSQGLQKLAGVQSKELPGLRDRALNQLTELRKKDPSFKRFYSERQNALSRFSLTIPESGQTTGKSVNPAQLEKQALQALERGDIHFLAEIAESILKKTGSVKPEAGAAPKDSAPATPRPDRLFSFSKETLEKAKQLGLTAARVDAATEYAHFCRYAWQPVFGDDNEIQWGATPLNQMSLPPGTPEAFKKRVQVLAIHPLVNSGGARFLPDLVAEDFLVEDFPEPAKGVKMPTSMLLSALGLKQRHGLSRIQIEQALLDHGADIVSNELGLEPELFRLVCIPTDLYLRLGESRSWGQQEIWTHFDGYMVFRSGRLKALAGGDVRFGGIYDLVSIGRDYEAERVIVRFAVVQRRRMETRPQEKYQIE